MSKKQPPKNPVSDEQENKEWGGPANRMDRGGSWRGGAWLARLSRRDHYVPGPRNRPLGFRIVKNIPKKEKRDE